MAYKNPILKSDVGQTNFENRGKASRAHVVSTIEVVQREVWTRGSQKRHSYK